MSHICHPHQGLSARCGGARRQTRSRRLLGGGGCASGRNAGCRAFPQVLEIGRRHRLLAIIGWRPRSLGCGCRSRRAQRSRCTRYRRELVGPALSVPPPQRRRLGIWIPTRSRVAATTCRSVTGRSHLSEFRKDRRPMTPNTEKKPSCDSLAVCKNAEICGRVVDRSSSTSVLFSLDAIHTAAEIGR